MKNTRKMKTKDLIEKFGGEVMSKEDSKHIKAGGFLSDIFTRPRNGFVQTISGGPNDWFGSTGVSCNPFTSSKGGGSLTTVSSVSLTAFKG